MSKQSTIYLALGTLIGSVTTYLLTRSYYVHKSDEELNEIRAYYALKQWNEKPEDTDVTPEKPAEETHVTGKLTKPDLMSYYKSAATTYQGQYNESERSEQNGDSSDLDGKDENDLIDEEIEEQDAIIGAYDAINASLYPELITPEEYYSQENGFDKSVLMYYEDDETLVDEDNEVVDLSIIGGTEFINNFGDYETDVLFVSNPGRSTDYLVTMEHNSYLD